MTSRPGAATFGAAGFLALQGADAMLPFAWLALAVGGAVALWRDEIDFVRAPDRLETSLLVFVAVAVVASLAGLDARRSFSLSVPVLAAVPLWMLIARSRTEARRGAWIVAGLLAAALTQAVLALIAVAALPDVAMGERIARAGAAWLVVPNDLAWIACLVPFALLLPQPRALVFAGITALALAFVVQSITLAGATGVTALAAAWLVKGRGLPSARAVLLGAGTLAGAIALAALVLPSMQARLQLWEAAVRVLIEYPLGAGLHNYVLAYRGASAIAPEALVDPRRTPWPHSLPLEIGAELGWAGLAALAFVVITIWAVLRILQARALNGRFDRIESALVASLAGFAALAISETSLLRMWTWFVSTTLLGLLATRIRDSGETWTSR